MYFSALRVWPLEIFILFFQFSFSDAFSETGSIRITSPASRQEVSLHRLSTGVDVLCSIEASFMPNITWYFNNTLLLSPSTRSTFSAHNNGTISLLDILTVTQPGVYICRASGRLGSLKSHNHTVNAFVPPKLITPQSDSSLFVLSVAWSTVLPCVSSLQSYLSVVWWFNGNLLKSHNRRYISHRGNLHIHKARAGFTGRYYCTVTNKFTNENFSGPVIKLFITNIKLPVYNAIPQIQLSDTLYVDAGSDINLEYNRLYEPLFNITWLLPSTALPLMAPRITNITAPSNYSVIVFVNERQKQATSIQVKINSPPVVRMNIPSSIYMCNDTLLSLSCHASATPHTTEISWYHNSLFVSTGDTLRLLPTSTADQGYYQCFARNQVGTGSEASLLRFPIAPHVHITQGREVLLSFGSPLILTCENTEGIFHGIFRWTHNLLELSESNELYIPYVTAENSGKYTCSVSVCSIDVRDSISVIVSEPVIELTQLLLSPHSVNISWPLHPNAARYSVAYQQGDQLKWDNLAQTQQVYFVATQLQTAVRYTFRVSYILLAANGIEETQEYTSDTIQLDKPPLIIFILPLSSTQLLIRWQWEGDMSSLHSFVIQYKLSDTPRNLTLLISEIDSTSYTDSVLSALLPNSEYSITIYGVKLRDSSWNTPYSITNYSATLPRQLTSSPPDMSVTYLPLSNSITIAFSQLSVSREYGDVLGYKVLVFLGEFPFRGDFYLLSKNETSLTVPLSPGVESYYIQVLAFNEAGDGPATGLYFYPTNYSTEMTPAPTNSTLPFEPWTLYLSYMIAIPVAICLTFAVILFVLIGKCAHMYHLNSIKEEAEGVRAKRYYDTHYMVTGNSPRVKLQSEHKSVSSITHYKGSLTNPVRERARAYQVALQSTVVETKFDTHTDTVNLQTDPTCERPLTPDSGRILADTESVSSIPQQHDYSVQRNIPLGSSISDRIKSAKSPTVGYDVNLAFGVHEFAV